MDRSVRVIPYQVFGKQDRVLVVVTFPGHVRYDHVMTQRQFPAVGSGTVRQHLSGLDIIAFENDRFLVDTGALVGTFKFQHFIMINIAVFRADLDLVAGHADNFTGMFSQYAVAGVGCHLVFHTGADYRCLRGQQRHRLTLHVGAHQRAVRVIVFQERNQGCRDRYYLFRRYVHIIRPFRTDAQNVVLAAGRNTFAEEVPVIVQGFVGLRHDIFIFFVRSQIFNFIGNAFICFVYFAVRRFNKTELIDNRKSGKGTDQTDVGTFRGLNRAHASIMGVVNVTDFIAGPFTGQTAGSQCRKTAFVGQLCQRIVLVHKLGKLAAAEEFFNSSHYRTDVDQRLGSDHIYVLNGHAFFYHSFHTGQADAELVL